MYSAAESGKTGYNIIPASDRLKTAVDIGG